MEIPKGNITGLLGANGTGKTTTIKMLASLISPDSGTVTMDGTDVFENNKEGEDKEDGRNSIIVSEY